MYYIINLSFLVASLFIIGCKESNNNSMGSIHETIKVDDYSRKIYRLRDRKYLRRFKGLVLITQQGDTKYSKAYGYSNLENKIPIKHDENFGIRFNNKQVTAVLRKVLFTYL